MRMYTSCIDMHLIFVHPGLKVRQRQQILVIDPDDAFPLINGFANFRSERKKKCKAKRNSWGLIIYCRQELVKGVTKIKSSSLDMIWLKLDHSYFGLPQDMYICVAYLVPDSSPYARDNDIFKEFSNEIDFSSRLGNIAIIGDLNARVGRKQELNVDINVDDETPVYNIATKCRVPLRKSEDQVANTRGRRLMQLMTDHDLLIANGRVCGDLSGNFTCCRWNGLSVVNMMIVSNQFLSRLNFLKIGDFD